MVEMKEAAWGRLLAMMRDGMVVPVVGGRLLRDAAGQSLQARLAAKLLADYETQLPPEGLTPYRELNEAVSLLKDKADLQDLYGDIHLAMRDLRKQSGFALPQALAQLAQIRDFQLVVTLTPDELLAQALQAEGRGVNEVVHSPKLPTSEGSDLPLDWQDRSGTVQLLYLFGKARPTPLYAIHDEDVLEYAHNVIAGGNHAPKAFLGALQDRNLLLIGCNFPDWLSRFMLRATRKGRLADQKGGREWLVEPLQREDPFIGFLGKYSPQTSVLSCTDPADFVAELHRRWMAEHLPGGAAAAPDPAAAEPATPESAMFFISYSRTTDLAAAVRLHKALCEQGVAESEIWFDRQVLEPGDRWRQRILDGIRSCRYFLPVVSRAAVARDEAFVFSEWDEATRRVAQMNRSFLLPLVVDTENRPETYSQPSVQAWVNRDINFGHAPGGVPETSAADKLRRLVREARMRV